MAVSAAWRCCGQADCKALNTEDQEAFTFQTNKRHPKYLPATKNLSTAYIHLLYIAHPQRIGFSATPADVVAYHSNPISATLEDTSILNHNASRNLSTLQGYW